MTKHEDAALCKEQTTAVTSAAAIGSVPAKFSLSEPWLGSFAEMSTWAKQLQSTAECEPSLLFRFLAASKGDVQKALRKLQLFQQRWQDWRKLGIDQVEDLEVDALLDGHGPVKGYWQVGGYDFNLLRTAWLFQSAACAPKDLHGALAGVKAAHRFFNGVASDLRTAMDGITVVVNMTGVTYGKLLADVKENKYVNAIGDYFTDVLPIRCRRIIFVGCPKALQLGVQAWARVAFSSKQRSKISFVPSLQELKAIVPEDSWPYSLQPSKCQLGKSNGQDEEGAIGFAPVSVGNTSAWCRGRSTLFDEAVASSLHGHSESPATVVRL
mmetsp:Transcript_25660/g.59793  ORF Transcript_25660/g.59793 Transcript_25660/m.59793 type:complete len:325 (+) Transcript_25660:59-1033(+)